MEMQMPTEIASPQDLFDLAIFRPRARSARFVPLRLDCQTGGASKQRPPLRSPFEEQSPTSARSAGSKQDHLESEDWEQEGAIRRSSSSPRAFYTSADDHLDPRALSRDSLASASPPRVEDLPDALSSEPGMPEPVASSGTSSMRTSSMGTSWLDDPSDDEREGTDSRRSSRFSSSLEELAAESATMEVLDSLGVHESFLETATLECAAAVSPTKATLIDVPSRRSSLNSLTQASTELEDLPSPSAELQPQTLDRKRCTSSPSDVPVTPPRSPSPAREHDEDKKKKENGTTKHETHDPDAELCHKTVLTPPHTPESKAAARFCQEPCDLFSFLGRFDPSTVPRSAPSRINGARIELPALLERLHHLRPPSPSSLSSPSKRSRSSTRQVQSLHASPRAPATSHTSTGNTSMDSKWHASHLSQLRAILDPACTHSSPSVDDDNNNDNNDNADDSALSTIHRTLQTLNFLDDLQYEDREARQCPLGRSIEHARGQAHARLATALAAFADHDALLIRALAATARLMTGELWARRDA
ncbi:MAG: hypothetical protein M1826_001668 [Phylliscum demangeonii]|nr:MAG: hypothetical protein M1826_001668 [Phylliscum demangeonii]